MPKLCLGKDIGKLGVTGNPMELVMAVLLALTDAVEAAFDVLSFASKSSILGDLNGGIIVDHSDGREGGKTLSRFTPLFGAKIKYRTRGAFVRVRWPWWRRSEAATYSASDVDMATEVCMVELAPIRAHGGAASIGAVLPACIREYC